MNSVSVTQSFVNTSNPYHGKITIIAVHPCHQQGPIKAFVDIRIGGAIEIYGAKIIQQTDQRAYVRLPDRPRTDGPGYAPIVKATDGRLTEAINTAVFEKWPNGGVA